MVAMASVAANEFPLKLLPTSTPVGGKCMDGTQAGFYFREGSSSLFVINMNGGGGCSTKRECDGRRDTFLGSSDYWKSALEWKDIKNGLLSTSCDTNPGFCEATAVDIPYCTQDVHTGTHTHASEATWNYFFDGFHNLVAIIDMLIADYGLGDATQVLLTGTSAGGIGALWNVDYVASRLPSATVKAAPIAGWYLPGPHQTDPSEMIIFSDYQHFKAGAHGNDFDDPITTDVWGSHQLFPQDCVADYGDDYLACATMHNRYKYIKASVFIMQNEYDPTHIFDKVGGASEKPSTNEVDSTKAYIEMVGEATRASLEQIVNGESLFEKAHPDGIFAPSCLRHGMPMALELNGIKAIPLLSDWFFQNKKHDDKHKSLDTCAHTLGELKLPCNNYQQCKIEDIMHLPPTGSPPTGSPPTGNPIKNPIKRMPKSYYYIGAFALACCLVGAVIFFKRSASKSADQY
jgi:hypothetical protein